MNRVFELQRTIATSVTDPVNNITKEREVKMMEAVVTVVLCTYHLI